MTVVCVNPDCPRYHLPMEYTGIEFDFGWKFFCPDRKAHPKGCANYRIVTKDKVGGTRGAGLKSNTNEMTRTMGRGL